MDRLLEIRESIDACDKEIVGLFEDRMKLCEEVAEVKAGTGKKVFDPVREKEKLAAVEQLATGDINKKGVREIFELIMSISRKMQYRKLAENGTSGKTPFVEIGGIEKEGVKVVYQGAEGSYSELAMKTYFGEDVPHIHVDSFRDAMSAIDDGSADYAVLPIENSTAGAVSEIYDLLEKYENYIVGEITIPIIHCLLGVPGAELGDITSVYSHPQSLMQCAEYLDKYDWNRISMANNAFAARKVSADGDKTKAAIAGKHAAKSYGLSVLAEGINTSGVNSTRFVIITNQRVFCHDADRISICFELPHESGSLYHMLSHFIYNDLNLTGIESRPIPDRSWEYRFFVDFDGNLADPAVRNALRGLREEARNMKILGNFKVSER